MVGRGMLLLGMLIGVAAEKSRAAHHDSQSKMILEHFFAAVVNLHGSPPVARSRFLNDAIGAESSKNFRPNRMQ